MMKPGCVIEFLPATCQKLFACMVHKPIKMIPNNEHDQCGSELGSHKSCNMEF